MKLASRSRNRTLSAPQTSSITITFAKTRKTFNI